MHIIDLEIWNQVNLLKLMQNTSNKTDNLWIKCIYTHYIKGDNVMNIPTKESHSWFLKHILKQRILYQQMQTHFQLGEKLSMKDVYFSMQNVEPKVSWRNLFYNNLDRSRAQFLLWLACNDKLETKATLHRFKIIQHLLFGCKELKRTWMEVLRGFQLGIIQWSGKKSWICLFKGAKLKAGDQRFSSVLLLKQFILFGDT